VNTKFLILLTICVWLVSGPVYAENTNKTVLELNYHGYTVWLDCKERGPVRFEYKISKDTGNLARKASFLLDPKVPLYCQQTSTKTYKEKGQRFDRGHLVPANHLDHSKIAIRTSQFMTNITPQRANMNRGAWYRTEVITDCYRDIEDLYVTGGVIFGDDAFDDYFINSHGIRTPSAFWKVISRSDRVIAWLIPNESTATWKHLDNYLITIDELEAITGQRIDVQDHLRGTKPETSWIAPKGCDRS